MPKIVPHVIAAIALGAAGVALAVVGLAGAGSAKSVYTYRATLKPGSEVPKPKAPATATGLFTATVTEVGGVRTLRWKLTFAGLSGKAVAAHLHKGKAGVSGGVLVPLCGPCRTGQTGQTKISSSAADVLERGLAYANVHTAKNAAGEVRGQVKLVDHVGTTTPSTSTEPVTTTGSDPPPSGY